MSIEFFGQLPPWVLGPVSQSGGTPTGGLIERGSNANGEYVKFADGTLICTSSNLAFDAPSTAVGSVFATTNFVWTFPAAYIAAPVVAPGLTNSSTRWLAAVLSNTTTGTLRMYSYVTSAIATNGTAMAMGRWF